MITIEEYENYAANLPRASHEMEHISIFGGLIAKGFVLIASTIERSQHLAANADPLAARARRIAQRKRRAQELRDEAAALEQEDSEIDTTA